MKIGCPYCTANIDNEDSECSQCGASFGEDTQRLILRQKRGKFNKALATRRKYDRIQISLKVDYSTAEAFNKRYLHNIGIGGVFIVTDKPLPVDTDFLLELSLPDGKKELKINCMVTWKRKREALSKEGKRLPSGMGVKFLELKPEERYRIQKIIQVKKKKKSQD